MSALMQAPVVGGRYQIVDSADAAFRHLTGRSIKLAAVGHSPNYPYIVCVGKVEGEPEALAFPLGLALVRLRQDTCTCPQKPFPHRPGDECITFLPGDTE